MVVSHEVDDLDVDEDTSQDAYAQASDTAADACFAKQHVYVLSSAYIASLIKSLPEDAKLTRGQTLLVARFAAACDEAWADQEMPPQ